MPLMEIHLIKNVVNPEQKRQIIKKLTDAMVSIEGENMRGVTWVKISEVTSGEWGIGASLREASEIDPRYGGFMNTDLAEYVISVNADIGDIQVDFVDQPDRS